MSRQRIVKKIGAVRVATSKTLKTKEDKLFKRLVKKHEVENLYDKYYQQHIDNEITKQWNLK
jgi:chorismate mutase